MHAQVERDKILIVDDEPQILSSIGDLLEDSFDVLKESSGESALETLRREEVSVILCDQRMPGLTGDNFFRHAQAISNASRILITGYADLSALVQAVNNGQIYAYVAKPWDPLELKITVERARDHCSLVRALNHERDLLRELMDHMPDLIYFKDSDLRFTRLNRVQAQILGLRDPRPAIGQRLVELIDTQDTRRIEADEVEIMGSGRSVIDQVETIRNSAGQLRWVSSTKIPLRNPTGEVVGLAAISRDVTERERTARQIRLLQVVTQAIGEADDFESALTLALRSICEANSWEYGEVWVQDPNGNDLQLSPAWCGTSAAALVFRSASQVWRLKPGEGLAGRVWSSGRFEWIPDLSLDERFSRQSEAEKAGMKSALAVPIVDDRRVRAVLLFCMMEAREEDSPLAELVSAVASQIGAILERKRLVDERDRFFKLTLDMFGIADFDGGIRQFNPAWEKVLGYPAEQKSALHLLDLVHPEDLDQITAVISRLQTQTRMEGASCEARYRCRDGSYRWLLWSMAVSPRERLLYVVGRDMSDKKELEEQLRHSQKMEAVGRLAGGIAHDFNNLITGITGFTSLALGQLESDSPTHQDLLEVQGLAERAGGLTRQLLTFSRRQIAEVKVLSINPLIATMSNILQRLLGERIELVVETASNLGLIRGVAGQIEQVLVNLAVNAADAMPQGGRLTISTANAVGEGEDDKSQSAGAGRYVVLTVSDTGCGMDPATKDRIFEPFFTTKAAGKGTGLGLSTVYGIVQQHSGEIRAHSELGQGATFKIYFPRLDAPASEAEQEQEREDLPRGSENVLVVEDEEGVRHLVERILKALGYTVFSAESYRQAQLLFARHQDNIELLLTDLVMPGGTGPALYHHFLETRPDLRVLYMSGYLERSAVERMPSGDEGALLQKPFTPGELARRIRERLEGRDS